MLSYEIEVGDESTFCDHGAIIPHNAVKDSEGTKTQIPA